MFQTVVKELSNEQLSKIIKDHLPRAGKQTLRIEFVRYPGPEVSRVPLKTTMQVDFEEKCLVQVVYVQDQGNCVRIIFNDGILLVACGKEGTKLIEWALEIQAVSLNTSIPFPQISFEKAAGKVNLRDGEIVQA